MIHGGIEGLSHLERSKDPCGFSSQSLYFAIDSLLEIGELARAREFDDYLPTDWTKEEPEDFLYAADAMLRNLESNHVGALMQYQWCPAQPGIGRAMLDGVVESAATAATERPILGGRSVSPNLYRSGGTSAGTAGEFSRIVSTMLRVSELCGASLTGWR